MSGTLTSIKPEIPRSADGTGGVGGGLGDNGGFGGRNWDDAREWAVPLRTYRTGMWMALVAIVMLFAAFTSALVIRRGISTDWVSVALPRLLYLNTGVLLASSMTLELSRRSLAHGLQNRFVGWWYATAALGVVFLAGQLMAWRELASRGVYLATNPGSSFIYLLTAAHGVHLLGGIAALFYIALRASRITLAPERRAAVNAAALYWHFMDGLWIYILLLLGTRL